MKKKKSLFLRLIQRAEEEKQKKNCGIWEEAEENVPVRERFHFSQKEKKVFQETKSFFQKEYCQKEREQEKKRENQIFLLPYGKEQEKRTRQENFSPLEKKIKEKKSKGKDVYHQREIWRRESFSEWRDEMNRQKEFGNLFFADMRHENQEKSTMEELSRYFSEVRETGSGQHVTIHIGQIRETVDVDRVMEEMTKKLWEARSMGRSRVERWR